MRAVLLRQVALEPIIPQIAFLTIICANNKSFSKNKNEQPTRRCEATTKATHQRPASKLIKIHISAKSAPAAAASNFKAES